MPLTRAELRRRAAAAPAASDTEVTVTQAAAAMGEVIAMVQAVEAPALRRRRSRSAADEVAPVAESTIPSAEAAPASIAESVVAETLAEAISDTSAATLPLRRRTRSSRTTTVVSSVPEAPGIPEFLDETIVLPSASSTHTAAEDAGPTIDEFELAAKVFSFTGETPIQVARAAVDAEERVQRTTRVRMAEQPRRPRRGRVLLKRAAAASFSISVVGVVGLLAIGTTTPVTAVGAFGQDVSGDISLAAEATEAEAPEIQAYVANSDAGATILSRSGEYDIESMTDVAAESGVTQFAGTWVNDETADVQWPFPVGVPISAQFGSTSYLSKFSRAHHGTDFTPGAGAEVHAVAAGTVRIATEAGGDYGVTVVIDHIIDGQLVSTRYGHMQYGSLRVSPGETVDAGDVIGRVGSTGKSTGAHLHLEVLLGGTTRIDPLPWLKEHTQG
ncbi:M23 family metallopeptidase [Microbacterium oleivorans]|uniref:M23 family metallopeptidase n=1 Tax=Microbacterium oleivorans TaxID=273677 RepID=UPI00203BB7AC|nr:peptidoglycan DD-metalloendopeptidase family protein [Microbacterium oleivorans]MCM3695642.1 peptidoglycan DD-metalloendopeptidase family protein [Microbacterium oleivorans]